MVQPSCAIGGMSTRVNAFLAEKNNGELGLGHGSKNCSNPEVVHALDDTWMSTWYLYYAGSYSICHKAAPTRQTPAPQWLAQGEFHLLEPSPLNCGKVRNSSATPGYAFCELDNST